MENNEIEKRKLTLDDLMQVDEDGVEFWYARDLMGLLGYTKWQNFEIAIKRAMVSADNADDAGQNHFAEVSKMVQLGSGAKRGITDYMLTRYACYLIAMNGDTRKQEIAFAQSQVVVENHDERHQRANRDNRIGAHRPHPLSGMPPVQRSTARRIVAKASTAIF